MIQACLGDRFRRPQATPRPAAKGELNPDRTGGRREPGVSPIPCPENPRRGGRHQATSVRISLKSGSTTSSGGCSAFRCPSDYARRRRAALRISAFDRSVVPSRLLAPVGVVIRRRPDLSPAEVPFRTAGGGNLRRTMEPLAGNASEPPGAIRIFFYGRWITERGAPDGPVEHVADRPLGAAGFRRPGRWSACQGPASRAVTA